MKDNEKNQKQLIKELIQLRQRIAELEASGRQRNRFEETLRTERDKAQQYLDIAEVILVALNKKGEITLINRKGNQILGYKEGELLGKNWFTTCLPSHLRKKMKSGFLKLMAGKRRITEFYENPALTKSGTERIIAWHNSLLKDAQGNNIGTLSSGKDITERKKAEAALHKSEDKYRTILENIEDGYYEVDLAGNFTFLNDAMCRIWGYPKEELMGMNNRQYTDKENAKRVFQAFNEVYRTGKVGKGYDYELIKKDGTRGYVEASISLRKDSSGKAIGFRGIIRDITERRQTEEALRESEATLGALINAPADSVLLLNSRGVILDLNKIAAERLGKSRDDLIGTLADGSLSEDIAKRRRSIISQIFETSRPVRFEDERDGIWYDTVAHPITDKDGAVSRIAIIARDITERKWAEKELRESEERFRLAFENANTGVCLVDLEGNLTRVNTKMSDIFGYTKEELERMTVNDIAYPEDIDKSPEFIQKTLQGEINRGTFEKRYFHKKGHVVTCEVSSSLVRDAEGTPLYFISHVHDITERKQAEKKLQESEEHYRTLFGETLVGICLADTETGIIIDCNQAMAALVCRERAELIGRPQTILHPPQNDKAAFSPTFKQHLTDKEGQILETQVVTRTGDIREVEIKANLLDLQGRKLLQGLFHDITERKRAGEALRESEEKYRELVENINDILYATDENGIVTYIAPTIEFLSGYTTSEIIGHPFCEFVYQEDLPLAREEFQEVVSGHVKPHEYRMVNKSGGVRWVRTSSRPLFREARFVGLRGVMTDITDRKQAEEEVKRGYEQLQETLHATVNALASTVEMKDQYTAGHQPGVTHLACAIAEEMGLSNEQIEGIRMAASIHDIGKIVVPAEILNKPGPLTDIQYEMVKMHPRAGFDVVKGIKFPWPVAQIVLQHHELMDGSGYPQGLSGEEIMMEARILTVANVVEAMTSHRPYRPAFDIKVSLAEISKNRGILYDPAVVDTCLRLFAEKGFTLDSMPR